jgi:hypothetical protein
MAGSQPGAFVELGSRGGCLSLPPIGVPAVPGLFAGTRPAPCGNRNTGSQRQEREDSDR